MRTNTKEEAIERLKSIELETKQLRKIIEDSDKKTIFERIKTFEDACLESGTTLEDFESWHKNYADHTNAYEKIVLIAEVLNEGWYPDFNNSNERKFYPYFKAGSAFGFSHTRYDYGDTSSGVGSRLCFRTEELARYAGQQFKSIYKTYMM